MGGAVAGIPRCSSILRTEAEAVSTAHQQLLAAVRETGAAFDPNRNRRQRAVYQVRRRIAHPPLTTARTYPAALAREGDEEIAAAIVAMKAQETHHGLL